MLNIVINFLEKMLIFLKNKQKKSLLARKTTLASSSSIKFSEKGKISMVFMLLIGSIFAFLITIVSMEVFSNNEIVALGLSTLLNLFLLFTLFKNLNGKYFFLVHLPLYIGLFSLIAIYYSSFVREIGLYNGFLNIFLIIFPLIFIIQSYLKILKLKCIDKVKNFFYLYNLGFFFIITLNVLFISIGFNIELIEPWSEMIIEILNNNYISGLWEGLFYIIFVFITLLYWVYTLHVYYDNYGTKRVNLHKAILIFLLIYCLGFTGTIIDEFYDYQIGRAQDIVNKEGNNYESYTNARVLFLDRAFYNKIKQGGIRSINESLFNKIYDSTIEGYYGKKISEYINDRRSFATNSSKIGDSADVILKLSEIENKVFETGGDNNVSLLETTYRFHFTNETKTNQEVILNFETPSKATVISSLKLGMDLELIGQIAPRGAARKVYEDSLRKNIDPALIEKVGLNTYSLKVFPIPSKTSKTQGRQLVEVKMLTPIDDKEIIYSPKFSIINLKFDDSSRMKSKVYNNDELIKEDIIKSSEIEKYISIDHTLDTEKLNLKSGNLFNEICLSDGIQALLDVTNTDILIEKNIGKKIKIFFDNSYSVERNNSNKFYKEIFDKIKNNNGKLNDVDLYSYNFDVTNLTEVSDINYWGFSDIDRAIDYIVNNNITNEKIIFITDDDNFNLTTKENYTRNYEKLVSNNISVIKIGKKIKTYKFDFNTIISATYGNIYEINSGDDIDLVVNKILDDNNKVLGFNNCKKQKVVADSNIGGIEELFFTGTGNTTIETSDDTFVLNENIEKIQAGIVSNLLLGNIKNANDLTKVATIQTVLSEKYNIINQFNSLIALETVQQQRDLDRYKKDTNKYETEYDNNSGGAKNIGSIGRDISFSANESIKNRVESRRPSTSGISFSTSNTIDSGLRGSSDSFSRRTESIDFGMSFSGRTNVSFVGLILMLIYLLEYIGFINFIIKYKKGKQD